MPELNPEILWEEGMLLRPQHMQAFSRHCLGLLQQQARSRPFSFGVRDLKILKEGVGNWTFEILSCEIVMPDGSTLIKDQTAIIEPVEFRHLKKDAPILDVWLALPFFKDVGKNVARPGEDGSGGVRYLADRLSLTDESSGANPTDIGVRRFHPTIFLGTRPPQGHATLQIAQLKKVVTDDSGASRYELSPDYVPASLSMDASPQLTAIIKDLLFRLEEKNSSLLSRLRHRQDLLTGDSAEPETLLKLQATNGVLPQLRQLVGQTGMHPFDVFLHLSRLIGDLAIFSATWEPPKLVLYNHDNPLQAYLDLKSKWLEFLERAVETKVGKKPFRESADLADALEVEIPPAFLERNTALLLGVATEQEPFQALSEMAGVRLAAPGDLDECRRMRTGAIKCVAETNLHPSLRNRANMVFLRIEQFGPRWESAKQASRLALDIRTTGSVESGFELFATGTQTEE